MHIHLGSGEWYLVGRYGGLALMAGAAWLSRRPWFPHRHTGYVALAGYVWPCRRCGKLPGGAYRAGAHGTIGPDGYDADGYDAYGFNQAGLDRRDQSADALYLYYSHQDMTAPPAED